MIVLDLIKFELQIFYMFYVYCVVLPIVNLSRYSDWLRAGDGPGSNPGGDEIFCTCPDWPWGPPSLL